MTLPMSLAPCTDPLCAVHGYGALASEPALADMVRREAATIGDDAIPTCARMVLRAWDRMDAIQLLARERPVTSYEGAQFVIPVAYTSPVAPGERVELVTYPDQHIESPMRVLQFRPKALHVSGAMHDGWVINDILLDGISQIAPHHDLPAALFTTAFPSVTAFREVAGAGEIRIIATRTGKTPMPIYGVLSGSVRAAHRLTQRQISLLNEAWTNIVGSPPEGVTDAAVPGGALAVGVAVESTGPAPVKVRMMGSSSVRVDDAGNAIPGQRVRLELPFTPVGPGSRMTVTRFARAAMRADGLQLAVKTPGDWRIHEIRVGAQACFRTPDRQGAARWFEGPYVLTAAILADPTNAAQRIRFGELAIDDQFEIDVENVGREMQAFSADLVGVAL